MCFKFGCVASGVEHVDAEEGCDLMHHVVANVHVM